MAVKHEIVIEIAEDGSVRFKTKGYTGKQCEAALEPFERAVGKTTKAEKTKDYYVQEQKSSVHTKT